MQPEPSTTIPGGALPAKRPTGRGLHGRPQDCVSATQPIASSAREYNPTFLVIPEKGEAMVDQVVRIGVQSVVIHNGEILLGQRCGAFANGTWGLPGGHLEVGETILQAAARELFEETGISAENLRLFCVTDPNPDSNYHMQIGVEVRTYRGHPQIMEPHKCSALDFFRINDLPAPMFVSSVDVIRNYVEGSFYLGPVRTASSLDREER